LVEPQIVIAGEAKQSRPAKKERLDCFVASLLAMTSVAENQKFFRGAVIAPPIANSEEFALPSVSGSSPRSLQQAPRA
jgi:hypothetical protein